MIDIQEIDGVRLDLDNAEFIKALELAVNTKESFFLTGKAGTGKTTFLKYLRKVSKKKMIVLAPTGVAAINAGGQTIHSFFQIPPSIYAPDDPRLSTDISTYHDGKTNTLTSIYENFRYSHEKKKIICELELLVIDEVSMVRCDLLDVVDKLLRAFRDNELSPFGGVQMVFIGDVFQLPPVVTTEEAKILFRFYKSEFFFSSRAVKSMPLRYVEMEKTYRQSDHEFINLLNRVRENKMLMSDFQFFKSILRPSFRPSENEKYITLATTNATVDCINEEKLEELWSSEEMYEAEITGEFSEKDYPTDAELRLKPGAQVMFLKNDSGKRYFNGKIGTVSRMDEDKIFVSVDYDDDLPEDIPVEREEWENVRYKWNPEKKRIEEEVIGTFKQFPLRLAWAITVHKSQGLTFEKVIADIGDSFTAGQAYVALSRCTSLDGLVLTSMLTPSSIKTDPRVLKFTEYIKSRQ